MNKLKEVMFQKNISCGYLYGYVHLITEIVCFYYLSKITNSNFVWLIPFIYDGLAFVPQALIGYISDKNSKINFGIYGMLMLFIGLFLYILNINTYISLIILCLGNACIHIGGAENTLRVSNGNLSHSAIFVAGGSFGVIIGKLLASINISPWIIIILLLTIFPFILLAEEYKNNKDCNCSGFNYVRTDISPYLIVLLSIFVVIVRGYMGYGIPTSWNKSVLQTVLLYVTMGLGKALGGILSDIYGVRKVALISTIFSIPFLCFGDNQMLISLIGVMLFSMTMSITLGILVSVLKDTPGLAFGLTTIGLFLGTAPIFFIKITNKLFNIFLIIILSILCYIILNRILYIGEKND